MLSSSEPPCPNWHLHGPQSHCCVAIHPSTMSCMGSHKPVSPSRTQPPLSCPQVTLSRVPGRRRTCYPLPLRSASCLSAHPGGRAYRLPPGAGALPWMGSTMTPCGQLRLEEEASPKAQAPFPLPATVRGKGASRAGAQILCHCLFQPAGAAHSVPATRPVLTASSIPQSLVGQRIHKRARRHLGLQQSPAS